MTQWQTKLFRQLKQKQLFEQAQRYALNYIDTTEVRPVYPCDKTLEQLSAFIEPLPSDSGSAEQIIEMLDELGSPATVNQTGGRYFGFVNGGAIPVGLAAKWLADVWDQNAGLYVMSPISATLEQVCENWLKSMFSLPDSTVAGFVGGTSVASLCGLAAARHHQLQKRNWDVNQQGLFGAPRLRVVMGMETHGTVVKMLSLLGLGAEAIEWVPCDEQGRMLVEHLPSLDDSCILVLQAGNVNSGAFDQFSYLCDKARQAGAWVHVDGAFGLWAAASTRFSHLTEGIEFADSWSVDGHKTLNTPYDCGVILCKHPQALTAALHQQGSYIEFSDKRDNMIYTPDMSRRARGIELWATIKYLGADGIKQLVDTLHNHAVDFAKKMQNAGFTVVNDVVFNQVLIRYSDEQLTQNILSTVQNSGTCWCGSSRWQDTFTIRVSICSWATTEEDIDATVDTFVGAKQRHTQSPTS